jgi:hypothetical protein
MTEDLQIHRVEVSFVGLPPAGPIERASGVSDVEVDGPLLRCAVCGSFQPFLEALRGYEVISLESSSAQPGDRSLQADASGVPRAKLACSED